MRIINLKNQKKDEFMKKFIVYLASLVSVLIMDLRQVHAASHEKAIVFASMPDHVLCENENDRVEISVLGLSGGGVLIRRPKAEELFCFLVNAPVLTTQPGITLLYSCNTKLELDKVEIYKNEENQRSALVYFVTKNGVPNPQVLSCKN